MKKEFIVRISNEPESVFPSLSDAIAHASKRVHMPEEKKVDAQRIDNYPGTVFYSYGFNEAEIESRMDSGRLLQAAPEMLAALKLQKRFIDNLFEKGNVPWGQTCGLDFALMNESLLALKAAIFKAEGP